MIELSRKSQAEGEIRNQSSQLVLSVEQRLLKEEKYTQS